MSHSEIPNTDRKQIPLISVIIPTHNRPQLLKEALESVYAQEGLGELFNIEVIVVYDVLSDITPEISSRFPYVNYLKQEKRGPSAARNLGLNHSKGKYVAFLDDDNLWFAHKLKVQVPVMEERLDIGVIYGQEVVTGDTFLSAWPESAPSGQVFEDFLKISDDFIPTDTLLIRREAFDKAGYFDESIPTAEHYDLCLRLAFYFHFLFIPGPVAHGRYSKDGLWHRSIVNGAFERTLPYVVEKALAMMPNTGKYEPLRRIARSSVVQTIARHRWDGGVDHVRPYLLEALKSHPWMVLEQSIMKNLRRVAHELVYRSDTPRKTLRVLCVELRDAVTCEGFLRSLKMRGLLAEVLMGAASALYARDFHRAAGSMAMRAVLQDFTHCSRIDTWKFMIRAIFAGPRWNPILAAVKKRLRYS